MPKKLQIGIVTDKWKTPFFEKSLKEKGYSYTLVESTSVDVFKVDILKSELNKLGEDVKQMQDKAYQSKMN